MNDNKQENKTSENLPEKKANKFGETEEMMRSLMSQELKTKLVEKINSNDQDIIAAIKSLLSEDQ